MIEKRWLYNELMSLCVRLRITDNEILMIQIDPNFTLPIWAMLKNCDIKLVNKILDELVENYNPKEWRGERKTCVDGKTVKIMTMFPFPDEFRRIKEKHYTHTTLENVGVPESREDDGEGMDGLASFAMQQAKKYREMSPEQKINHIKTMKDRF